MSRRNRERAKVDQVEGCVRPNIEREKGKYGENPENRETGDVVEI